MQKLPLISIVVPVYNQENYLEKCIDSILNQTFRKFELILVDDGSSDKSSCICDQYAKVNPNIKVLHKMNEGPSIARASGLKIADGEYISFVDADDYIEAEMISTMIANFHDDVDIVESGYFVVSDEGKVIETVGLVPEVIKGARESLIHYSVKRNTTDYLWNKLFKVNLFQNVVFPKLYAGEDSCLLTQLFANARGVTAIPIPLYNHVMTPGSLCRKPFNDHIIDNIYAGEFMFCFYENNFPDLKAFAAFHICNYAQLIYAKIEYSSINNKEIKQNSIKGYFYKYYVFTNNSFVKSKVYWKRRLLLYIFFLSPKISNIIYKYWYKY